MSVINDARVARHIEKLVAAAPPLSPTQKSKLAAIMGDTNALAPVPKMSRTQPVVRKERAALYRHFDAQGELLYVGIAKDPDLRRKQHRSSSAWVEFAKTETIEWFDDRASAKAAESDAIRAESPLFNSLESSPERDRRLVAYLVAREAFHLLVPSSGKAA